MLGKLSGWDDTIVALASPPGSGAIGIIRISGKNAFPIVNKLFSSKNLLEQKSHTLHVGYLHYQKKVLDEVVLSLYKSPRSYTGEDVIEISCHGSQYILDKVLQALVESGARIAKPGEFTQRAFLNGKLDLTQAEAVADLIASNTEASQRTALQNMRGGFSHLLKELRDQLLQFSALIELELDFSQEDVEFADRRQLFDLLSNASTTVSALLHSFRLGNVIKNGVQVAIVGKPNAGKSTLLNTLLNEERAIVSDIAGTTRDTIEETLNINGILFRLIDTAGIREHTADVIESIGVERSLEKMRKAQVVLYIFDVKEMGVDELQNIITKLRSEKLRFILVGNKADELPREELERKYPIEESIIFISAKNEENVNALKETLYDTVVDKTFTTEDTIITNQRHVVALQKVQDSLENILNGLQEKLPGDLIALDIRACLHYLGEITGEITNEDQLDYIFSKFCIGK